jgi:hypothetical protein
MTDVMPASIRCSMHVVECATADYMARPRLSVNNRATLRPLGKLFDPNYNYADPQLGRKCRYVPTFERTVEGS